MTAIPDAAVQAALGEMRKYRYARVEEQPEHYVLITGELMSPVFEGTAEACDEWRTERALAAAFPVMLREVAASKEVRDHFLSISRMMGGIYLTVEGQNQFAQQQMQFLADSYGGGEP